MGSLHTFMFTTLPHFMYEEKKKEDKIGKISSFFSHNETCTKLSRSCSELFAIVFVTFTIQNGSNVPNTIQLFVDETYYQHSNSCVNEKENCSCFAYNKPSNKNIIEQLKETKNTTRKVCIQIVCRWQCNLLT